LFERFLPEFNRRAILGIHLLAAAPLAIEEKLITARVASVTTLKLAAAITEMPFAPS
jgi:hypothetical protein